MFANTDGGISLAHVSFFANEGHCKTFDQIIFRSFSRQSLIHLEIFSIIVTFTKYPSPCLGIDTSYVAQAGLGLAILLPQFPKAHTTTPSFENPLTTRDNRPTGLGVNAWIFGDFDTVSSSGISINYFNI